jgi:hypothetical protein
MKTLFGFYQFPEKWAEINPRFSEMDGEVNMNLQLFTDLDVARAALVDSDCLPHQIQHFMVKVSVALSYCAVMAARIGGHLNQANELMDKLVATKSSKIAETAKSEAAIGRAVAADLEVINLKWGIKDLEVMHQYSGDIFRTLMKDAENWRARFYGAHSDKKLTPSVNAPFTGDEDGVGIPPRVGGQQQR